MNEPPKRRWYQFSLRTLLIVVTLLGVVFAYVGTQAKTVMGSKAAMVELIRGGGQAIGAEGLNPRVLSAGRDYSISFLRRLMGDHAAFIIFEKQGTNDDERRRLRDLFPESKILPLPVPDP